MTSNNEVEASRQWVDRVVVGFNLCPFAKRELNSDRVRFALSAAATEQRLLEDLAAEINLLSRQADIETTLLIHPYVLSDFYDFNDFLFIANEYIVEQNFEGIFQVASFHPNYQFAGVGENDAANYTNRSPYPMLHILREESVSKAIDSYPDVDLIPERNVALMQEMGFSKLRDILKSCYGQQ